MVAPIALYPDSLLAQVLAASTYPLEIVTAGRWVKQHSNLTGKALVEAAGKQDWDPSIQALVAFPSVLQMLDQNLEWTTALGNGLLAQQGDVMSAVQRMRQKAQASGKLQSNAQQQVQTTTVEGQPSVVIQPANPEVVYVLPIIPPRCTERRHLSGHRLSVRGVGGQRNFVQCRSRNRRSSTAAVEPAGVGDGAAIGAHVPHCL